MKAIDVMTDPALAALGEQTPIDQSFPVRFHDFQFGDRSTSRIAIARHRADPSIAVLASLGGISSHAFVSVVDGFETQFAEALAKVEHIDTPASKLRAGDYVELRRSAIASELGWVAMQLLEMLEDGPTTGFPDHLRTSSGVLHCLWAVPLTEEELRIRTKGLDALLGHLYETRRNPMRVRSAGDDGATEVPLRHRSAGRE